MDVSVPLLWILYICLGFVHGDSDSNYKENTIPVDITYNHRTTDRDFVNVKVTPQTGSDVISLRLSRVKRNILSPSLLVVTQDGLVEDILNSDSMQLTKDKTFYKDKENTSAFSIDWNDGQINKVQGHFVKDGFLHSVISNNESVEGQESTRSKGSPRSSDGVGGHVALPHSMSKFTMPINLTGDTIYFNESTIYTKQSRRRRQTEDPQQLYVEYVAVTDFKNYLKWKADLNALNMTAAEKDLTTKYNMLEFYQHVVHGIDVIFKTLSSQDLQVEIVLTGLVICNESDICPWSEKNTICPDCDTVDDKECLYDFSKWRRNVLTNLLDHDHAALFTGYDLYYTLIQSKKTVGLAYMSNMCQNGSVSLVEERRNALSIHIAAHELGHRQSPSASQTTPKRHPSTTTHQTMPTRHHNMSTHPKTTNYTSSKPTSTNAGFAPTDTGAASTSTLKPIISKSTTSDPSQNSTSLSKFNISTDTPMDSSTSSTVSNSTVTVNSNTSTINSTGALEISTNMNSHIQQTTPSYNATDNISYSTKSRSVTSMQNSTVLPDGDDNVIDKLKPTPKIPSNIGTKFTTRMSFDSTTDRADANLLNKASNIQDSNFFLIVTSFTLFHKFVLFYTS
ncbi:uncharacterized protein LOC132550002 [Ylistrum balloti]|uniref:uncharacterized protein LOC132550002 n=1 Tax=Ylistrum balloti TaxID=509963 RepID=UPI002905AF1B|nr:uncharacterized protein LOC132550002 [Ylistrum balloti]